MLDWRYCFCVDETEPGVDKITLLTALTIFLHCASLEVTAVEPLKTCCIQKFQLCMESKDPTVSRNASQTLYSCFFIPRNIQNNYLYNTFLSVYLHVCIFINVFIYSHVSFGRHVAYKFQTCEILSRSIYSLFFLQGFFLSLCLYFI